ncbi:MAG: hypothetical protein M3N32_01870 [Actinomycetota bacterium]|nr:hypothetical protein [Actinomycetota bacterium]
MTKGQEEGGAGRARSQRSDDGGWRRWTSGGRAPSGRRRRRSVPPLPELPGRIQALDGQPPPWAQPGDEGPGRPRPEQRQQCRPGDRRRLQTGGQRRCGMEAATYLEIKRSLSRRKPVPDPASIRRLRAFGEMLATGQIDADGAETGERA